MDQIKITLETLYDILRNEKKREDLQKLEETFYLDFISYLREKRSLLQQKKGTEELFAAGEREKLEYELRSIQRIMKELYEKREKKIIEIALNKSKTGSDIIDTSAMLREEKEFYYRILIILDHFRRGVLPQLFQAELPSLELSTAATMEGRKEHLRQQLEQAAAEREGPEEAEPAKPAPPSSVLMIKVKFIHPLPSFVWKDLQVYGPYDKGQEIDIFPEVAELLVRKGRAVKL